MKLCIDINNQSYCVVLVLQVIGNSKYQTAEKEKLEQLYGDLKKAFGMMEKRLQDRIDYLKNANGILTADKVELEKQLVTVGIQNRALQRKNDLIISGNASIAHLDRLMRDKDRALEIAGYELQGLRKERQLYYDMASDAQMYGIFVARLLKAFNK